MTHYTLRDFDYELPEELIAQCPAEPRDASRLLVYDRSTRQISHDIFRNIGRWLHPETCLVVNNSRVESCRLLFDEGRREVFVLEELPDGEFTALVRPGRRFREGEFVEPVPGGRFEVLEVQPDGVRRLRATPHLEDPLWDPYRRTPFPPYIRADESLAERYQTVYSRDAGSKAAPTAGLHFTERLLRELRSDGFQFAEVTLHVGTGTFAPVREEEIAKHEMHSEWYRLTPESAATLSSARHRTAVGTTSFRVLETIESTLVEPEGTSPDAPRGIRFEACSGDTRLFVTPGFPIRHTDSLITNYHLPKSTLLMLVAALTGVDELHRIYLEAIRERYRFYSFGDAMLIL